MVQIHPFQSTVQSGISLFSRFTPEALLLEGLAICTLCAIYAASWVIKKRRLGVVESAVPAQVVRDYLNELIVDAETLRNQLFGLLSAAGISVRTSAQRITTTAPAVTANLNPTEHAIDPMALEKMAALEAKIHEQTITIEKYMSEKGRIEKELAAARAAGPSTPGKAPEAEVTQLRDRVSNLEGKLAEYSVIEDDLANLKRLQQENAQLRAALGGSGGSVATSAVGAAPAASTSPTATMSPAAEAAIGAAAEVMPAQKAAAVAAPVAEAVAIPVAEPSFAEPSFEGLVDQVESSLGAAPAQTIPTVAQPATAPSVSGAPGSTSQPSAGTISPNAPQVPAAPGKSDADLVAEFEKMLNS